MIMKELSIEEKAARYDRSFERARDVHTYYCDDREQLRKIEHIFPELKESESEDEKIRKGLIEGFQQYDEEECWRDLEYLKIKDIIAYLKKHGKNDMGISEATKKRLEDNLNKALEKETPESLNEFLEEQGAKVSAIEGFETEFERQVSGLIASAINKEHEYNQGYVKWAANALLNYAKHELEKQGWQKPVMIQLKFKIGDVIKRSNSSVTYTVTKIDTSRFQLDGGHWLKLDRMSEFDLVGEKTADTIKPKFKVGNTVKDPYGDLYHITEIIDDSYKTDEGRFILFENQEVYTLSNFTAWSEKDETRIKSIIVLLKSPALCAMDGNKGIIEENIKYLKSFRDRIQLKQGWSEEDERMYRGLHNLIYSTPYCDSRKELSDWLESLRAKNI